MQSFMASVQLALERMNYPDAGGKDLTSREFFVQRTANMNRGQICFMRPEVHTVLTTTKPFYDLILYAHVSVLF